MYIYKINMSEYQNESIISNWDEVVETFEDMKLKKDLLHGILSYCFEKPSAILIHAAFAQKICMVLAK